MILSEKMEILGKEVELFIQYGVRESEQQKGLELLRRYKSDPLALHLMRAFYSSLPDPEDEAIVRITFIQKKNDVFLLGVSTLNHNYFFMATDEKAVLLGENGEEILERELLDFFGYIDAMDFLANNTDLSSCAEYRPVTASNSNCCPICLAVEGKFHLLGCPVEVCPWCDGQLSRCGCRFEQLGLEEFEGEENLQELERILEEKGRIPFTSGQQLSYLSDVED